MAAALLADRVRREPQLADVEIFVTSAGLDAFPGQPAADEAVRLLKEEGIDLTGHTSEPFDRDGTTADLILTMTSGHKQRILSAYPHLAPKVFTLTEFAEVADGRDIADPFLKGPEAYRTALEEIRSGVDGVVGKLITRFKDT